MGQFVDAIVALLLALAIAFLLTPVVNFLEKRGVPRVLATVLTYIVVLAALGGFVYVLIFSLVQQVVHFSDTIYNFAINLPETLKSVITSLKNAGISQSRIDSALQPIQDQAENFAGSLPLSIYTFTTNAVAVFLQIFVILVLGFYLTMDGKRIRDNVIGIVPKRWMSNALLFEDALNRVVGNYIRGQLTLALIIGVATSLICVATSFISHKNDDLSGYALICGVLAFLFETIPMVGPALASITPLLLSLLIGGDTLWQRTIFIAICFIVVQMAESNILGPRIVGHAVGLHPVAAILSLLVFGKLFGVFGALLATPIVAAGWVVIASIYRSARGETADQIMAQKKAPWSLNRPKARITRPKRETSKDELRSRVHVDNRVDTHVDEPRVPFYTRTSDRIPTSRRTIDLSAAARRTLEQERTSNSGHRSNESEAPGSEKG
jgi:predicted PurR-regulated permease PerM